MSRGAWTVVSVRASPFMALLLLLAVLCAACWPRQATPTPPPSPLVTLTMGTMSPGDFTLDGLAKMKVAKVGGCTAIVALDAAPETLLDGTLFYTTVNRLTGERVELQGKVHGAWWDVPLQRWVTGWVDQGCLVYR